MKVALVGCGLIGGSLALALRRCGMADQVIGHDIDAAAAERARALGILDAIAFDRAAIATTDLILLAVPVRALGPWAHTLAAARTTAIVTDVGSTKAEVVRVAEAALGGRFVGGHPLAGSERAGPDAARAELFEGRRVVLTPTACTDAAALECVTQLWRRVGADVVTMEAARHDHIMAAISHLPHVVAYALVGALATLGAEEFRGFAGGGFTDTTRIAATPAPMWIDVFLENRAPVMAALEAFEGRLAELRRAITTGDASAIGHIIDEARMARTQILT